MSDQKTSVGGSRFLYDSFDVAAARIEANERVANLQFDALGEKLQRIEGMILRLEKRLWLAIYGVVGVTLADGFVSLVNAKP